MLEWVWEGLECVEVGVGETRVYWSGCGSVCMEGKGVCRRKENNVTVEE